MTIRLLRAHETERLWPFLAKMPLHYDVEVAKSGLRETAFCVSKGAVFAVEEEGKIVAFTAIEKQYGRMGALCFIWLAYSKNRKAGKMLLEAVNGWARRNYLSRIVTHYCGRRMALFLKRFGFQETAAVCEMEVV